LTWRIPDLADCIPGIAPTEYNVLIAPAEFQERTSGGVFIPEAAKEREEYATQQGRLVAVSPVAFTFEKWPAGARKPEVRS
jgi:co-chaperonin GroES (HSP10)